MREFSCAKGVSHIHHTLYSLYLATSTDKRSVTLLATYNTRSVHAVTQRAQQNLRHFTAIRPCFQQFAVDNMDDNVSRSNITTILKQFASNC